MNHYCPRCRELNEWGRQVCERCGAPLRGRDGETYAQKLIWALRHPEAATALRAAVLLGEKRVSEATGPLLNVLNAPGRDPYLGAAAARALGAVGDPAARTALIETLERGPVPVRLAAVQALEALGAEEEVVRALHRASQDRSANVREEASRVLKRWSGAAPISQPPPAPGCGSS